MAEKLIELKRIDKAFDGEIIFDNYSLDVYEGEILVVMGASGIGKSTLLKLMAGLLKPDAGDVLYHLNVFDGVHMPFPFVFQDASTLLPWCTVMENIRLIQPNMSEKDVCALLKTVSLADDVHKKVSALSGGMKQRVGLARALACESRIILMDEPFASLDAELRSGLYDHIKKLNEGLGITIVMVTHDSEASNIATRTINI